MNFRIPEVIKNLLILNVLFYLATLSFPEWMYNNLALYHIESPLFKPHQFVSHMFMHSLDFTHVLFNMFMLWMFGSQLEMRWGAKRFLTYYLLTGLGAAALHMAALSWELGQFPEGSYEYQQFLRNPTVGASGAVYGVLLGFGMMFPNQRIMLLFPPIPMRAITLVIILGAIEFFQGLRFSSNIAHFAHLGGMLFGYLLIRYWKTRTML